MTVTITQLKMLQGDVGDLVARHDRATTVIDFAKYADDPHGFCVDVLRCQPWEKQTEIAEAVRDHSRVVVSTANGIGKDWITARIALWWVYCRRGFVILTGPTERQVRQILMKQVRQAFTAAPELPGELLTMELRVEDPDECGILAMTSDNADKLTGFHHPRLLVCVTEGQGVEDQTFEAAAACATGSENRVFVYGNPTRPTGKFHDYVEKGDQWYALTIPATLHPNVVTGTEQIPGAVSQAFIDGLRDEYGADSDVYRSRVLAKFPSQAAGGLIQRAWLRAAFDRHESKELEIAAHDHRLVLALDVARFGDDSCVLAFVRGPVVEKLVEWKGSDTVETVQRVAEFAEASYVPNDYNRLRFPELAKPPTIVIDGPGLGAGVVDVMKRITNRYGDHYNVVEYNGAEQALEPSRYLNRRAESHWKLRELLKDGKVALPRDSLLEEEALAIEWQLAPNGGRIQIVSKDLVRKTLRRSPDRLDAVVLGLAASMGNLFHRAWVGNYALVGHSGLRLTNMREVA